MEKTKAKKIRRTRIHRRIRKRVSGTTDRPRMAVYKSGKHTYVQIVDDLLGKAVIGASTASKTFVEEAKDLKGVAKATLLGKKVAEKVMEAGYKAVVFDRGGYLYHGRVKAVAEGAREQGLKV